MVYAKPPFGGPERVLEYLGRYTHRVAIANSRLTTIDDDTVSFRWKDYRHHDRQKIMTLDAGEFIRRFLLHVLPDRFQRIRHYGLLGNRARESKLARCRQLLDAPPPPPPVLAALSDPHDRYEALTGRSLRACPVCAVGIMRRTGTIPATVGRAQSGLLGRHVMTLKISHPSLTSDAGLPSQTRAGPRYRLSLCCPDAFWFPPGPPKSNDSALPAPALLCRYPPTRSPDVVSPPR